LQYKLCLKKKERCLLQYTVLPQSLSYSRVFSVKPEPIASLYSMLCTIEDPRRAQGRRHKLSLVLTLAVLAICCGQVSYQALEEWVVNYQPDLKLKVPFLAEHLIDASTFYRVFSRLEVQELEKVLGGWLQRILPLTSDEPIALDGKTLSGIDCHLLSAFAHFAKGVLFEIGTDTKGKEIPLALDLLTQIPVKNHIITADALHTQKQFCQKVTNLGGGYCLTAKGNQHYLEADINLFFSQPPFKSIITTTSKETRAKGQITTHKVEVSQELNDYLAWPGITHVWKLKRQVTNIKTKQTRQETVVGIARLLKKQKPEEQIIDLVRGHWSIENRLHRQRDVIFMEDRSTIRKRSAPQVMAALKNLVISMYHRASVRYFPTAFRKFLACPDELFELLGLTHLVV
jgi:predicted transposase YbfD/YdcC